jgi:hypothetical protein
VNRGFYSLPDPREVGLKWRQFEQAREKVRRIEQRHREAAEGEANLQQHIRKLEDVGVRSLAEAILEGSADPSAPTEQLEKLGAKLREQRRLRDAIAQALPKAEEELRQVVYEHQARWIEEADAALERAIRDERKAYAKAQELIEKPRAKRLYLEALARWVRYVQPTFGTNADVAIPTAIQPLTASADRAEQQLQERRYNEQLQEQQQEGVA